MKAIVTGGSGFIGTNLCRSLLEHEWDVISIDDLSSGRLENQMLGMTHFEDSILNKELLDRLLKEWRPDVIFHLAAIPRVSYSVEYPFRTTEVNVMGTLTILDAIKESKHKPKLVYSSSSSVYGGADVLPTPEDHPKDPKSPYAMQKWQAEQWCTLYAHLYDLDIVSLRYFNVFGPFSRYGGAYSTVLSAWMQYLYVDEFVVPYLEGDGEQTRDFCFVDNVVQANINAADSIREFKGESYNIAQGERHSLIDVKEILEGISGKTLDLELRPERVGDVKHTLADIAKAQNDLGYNPSTDFEKQVKVMADWYEASASQIQQGNE